MSNTHPSAIMTVPENVYNTITQLITLNGALPASSQFTFSNCVPSTVVGLPDFTLGFATGTLVLTAEDYFAFNPETNECLIKLK